LRKLKETEIHYDFESPALLAGMIEKEYTPDTGMAFALGDNTQISLLDKCLDTDFIGTHSID
jgi:hypothetical protein